MIILGLPVAFFIWFVTAPAGTAIQRIVSGGNSGILASFVSTATDSYESPMMIFEKNPTLKRANERLSDFWCDVLGAPDTTP